MRAVPGAAALARRTRRRKRRTTIDGRTGAGQELSAAGALPAGEHAADLAGLVAAAALELPLERPAMSLDEVMDARYESGTAKVRSWRNGWT